MARWTVTQGEHTMVIETIGPQIAVEVQPDGRFVGGPGDAEEMRRKLALAINVAHGETQP